jgi:hypothetical protein
VTEETHALPREEKAMESEQGEDRCWMKSMHQLERRRQGKVSEARIGDREKEHTL